MGSLGVEPFQVCCQLRGNSLQQTHADYLQTTFAVPLHCDGCIKDVSGAVQALDGKRLGGNDYETIL